MKFNNGNEVIFALLGIMFSMLLWAPIAIAASPLQKGIDAYLDNDYKTAYEILYPLARQGDSEAQHFIGSMFGTGNGVPKDKKVAVSWIRKSAAQGNHQSENLLGMLYEGGEEVEKNVAEAVRWYRKAAEGGYRYAQRNLGLCYLQGKGVVQSDIGAKTWFYMAALQGEKDAQYYLANLYKYGGKNISINSKQALKWYKKSAEQGHALSKKQITLMDSDGNWLFEIKVKDIDARSLLSIVADRLAINFIAGNELNRESVSVNLIATGFRDMIMTLDTGLDNKIENGIHLMGSPCRVNNPPAFPIRESYKKEISVNFQSVSNRAVGEMLAKAVGLRVDYGSIVQDDPLTMRLKDVTIDQYLRSLATVQGWSVVMADDNAIKINQSKTVQDCVVSAGAIPGVQSEMARIKTLVESDGSCLSHPMGDCSPFDGHALSEISLIGYMRLLKDEKYIAFVKDRNGVVRSVKEGETLGNVVGRIEKITQKGLVVKGYRYQTEGELKGSE